MKDETKEEAMIEVIELLGAKYPTDLQTALEVACAVVLDLAHTSVDISGVEVGKREVLVRCKTVLENTAMSFELIAEPYISTKSRGN